MHFGRAYLRGCCKQGKLFRNELQYGKRMCEWVVSMNLLTFFQNEKEEA